MSRPFQAGAGIAFPLRGEVTEVHIENHSRFTPTSISVPETDLRQESEVGTTSDN